MPRILQCTAIKLKDLQNPPTTPNTNNNRGSSLELSKWWSWATIQLASLHYLCYLLYFAARGVFGGEEKAPFGQELLSDSLLWPVLVWFLLLAASSFGICPPCKTPFLAPCWWSSSNNKHQPQQNNKKLICFRCLTVPITKDCSTPALRRWVWPPVCSTCVWSCTWSFRRSGAPSKLRPIL